MGHDDIHCWTLVQRVKIPVKWGWGFGGFHHWRWEREREREKRKDKIKCCHGSQVPLVASNLIPSIKRTQSVVVSKKL